MLLPGGLLGLVVVLGALAQTTVLLALGGEATHLSVLVDGVGDPVDTGVSSDGLVRGVDKDDLVVLVDTVLVDPVRVENSQVATSPGNPLLGGSLQTPRRLEVVDTLPDGLTVGSTLGSLLLPVTPPDPNTVDEVALFGLVSESPSLVGTRRSRSSVDNSELSVLPASDTGDELKHVGLLLGVELLEILVGTHF